MPPLHSATRSGAGEDGRHLRGRSIPLRHSPARRQARHRCASTASDAGLAPLSVMSGGTGIRCPRRRARPPRPRSGINPNEPAADCPAWRKMPALRLRCSGDQVGFTPCASGPALGTCASTCRLPPRKKPARRALTPSVSVRCTSLRCAAANEPLRWPAASLRSVPRPEAGGDRQGRVTLADSHASRIVWRQTGRGPRPRKKAIRYVRPLA